MQPEFKAQGLSAQETQEALLKIEAFLNALKMEWDAENKESGTKNWFYLNRIRLIDGTMFIIKSLDKMIQYVEDLIPSGEDKKAIVMLVTEKLFDYIVVETFPFILKPFAPTIKRIVVEVIIGSTIDFIVSKYNEGIWKMNKVVNGENEQQESQEEKEI